MTDGKKIDESQLKLSWITRREYALKDVQGLEREQLVALLERVAHEERRDAQATSASMLTRAQA